MARDIVRRAVDLGVTLFDTAEVYGLGRSERILGEALGQRRESVFLATKILPVLPVAPVVEQRAVASANRLGTRLLDLYQVHGPNPLVSDRTTMRGMRALQRVGLVGEVGVSNYPLARWQAAEQALGTRVLSNQVRYSLADRAPEKDLLPFAAEAGRVVIAYSPLAQGLLSGRYDRSNRPANRVRASNPLFLPENLDRAGELIGVLREVADAHRGHRRSDRAGLGDPAPGGHRHPRRVQRRAARGQRRGRRYRAVRRRVRRAERGLRPVPAGHRAGRGARHRPGPPAPITGRGGQPAMAPWFQMSGNAEHLGICRLRIGNFGHFDGLFVL